MDSTFNMAGLTSQKRFFRLALYVIGVATIIFVLFPFITIRNSTQEVPHTNSYLQDIRNGTLGVRTSGVLTSVDSN